jgi:hypothetical protein
MNRRKCKNCGGMFSPYKHIKNQRYCSKKKCQRARDNIWRYLKLKYDKDYMTNKKKSQRNWVSKHPDYWVLYKKYLKGKKRLPKKFMVKILVKKGILTNLRKEKSTNCNCRLVLTA